MFRSDTLLWKEEALVAVGGRAKDGMEGLSSFPFLRYKSASL